MMDTVKRHSHDDGYSYDDEETATVGGPLGQFAVFVTGFHWFA